MTPIPAVSLADLAARFDTFFLDQFGVLRDDAGLYPGAAKAVEALKREGKTVLILSNSGKTGEENARRIAGLGIARESFDRFVTSGDVGLAILGGPDSPVRKGGRCLEISTDDKADFAARLAMTPTSTGAEADLVVIAGSRAEAVSMEDYAALLKPAAERGVPAFCLNPDFRKLWNGHYVPGAGAIADLYEELGGTVTRLGKPYPDIYAHALALCGEPDPSRTVCVGDSIEHDILGAARAGLASVLVGTGLAQWQSEAEQEEEMERVGTRATYRMARFSV